MDKHRLPEALVEAILLMSGLWMLAAPAYLYVTNREHIADLSAVYRNACLDGFSRYGGLDADNFRLCDAGVKNQEEHEESAWATLAGSVFVAAIPVVALWIVGAALAVAYGCALQALKGLGRRFRWRHTALQGRRRGSCRPGDD